MANNPLSHLILEFEYILKEHWYFSLIYIWWAVLTILCFKRKQLWKQDELPFNWFVYLIIVGVLIGLFFWNRFAFKDFFNGLWMILLSPFALIATLFGVFTECMGKGLLGKGVPVLIKIIVFIIMLVVAALLIVAIIWGVIIVGVLYVIWWLLNDLKKKWFGWFRFTYQYSIPLLALIFYPATELTFNFLFECLTRHPLEGSLTIKASRKIWLLIIGLLILLTGILGKILV